MIHLLRLGQQSFLARTCFRQQLVEGGIAAQLGEQRIR
jgi:hypothetical protein